MKEQCVILDTNFITENKKTINDIKKKIEPSSDIFIPRIVIEELEAQKSRIINDDYLKIKGLINKNSDLFNYEEKFTITDAFKKSESKIKDYFENYCNNNIIEYDEITLADILNRLKFKEAPFINENGSSDKGFKDSVIWLSMMKNKEVSKYKKIILVTNC